MLCPRCGTTQADGATVCTACGNALSTAAAGGSQAPIAPNEQMVFSPQNALAPLAPAMGGGVPVQGQKNPLAIAGFVCGLLGLTPFWVGCALCILAIVFSSIGMSKASSLGGVGKGLAIAGLVLGIAFFPFAACGI
jgi:hypothetical protein